MRFRSQPLSSRYILLLFALSCPTCSTAVCTAKIVPVSSAVFVRILAAVFPRDLSHPFPQSSKTSALPPFKWQDLCLQCRERPNGRASFSRALDPLFFIPTLHPIAATAQHRFNTHLSACIKGGTMSVHNYTYACGSSSKVVLNCLIHA